MYSTSIVITKITHSENEGTNYSGNTRDKCASLYKGSSACSTLLSIFHKSGMFPDRLLSLVVSGSGSCPAKAGCQQTADICRMCPWRRHRCHCLSGSCCCCRPGTFGTGPHGFARDGIWNVWDGCPVAKVSDVNLSHKKRGRVCLGQGTIKMRKRN